MERLEYQIVGMPKRQCKTNMHAMIDVFGSIDEHNNYVPFAKEIKRKVFAPNGDVFAYNFFDKYPTLENYVVSFYTRPKDEDLDGTHTNYIWDFKQETKKIGYEADVISSGSISLDDSERNYEFVNSNFSGNETKYYVCDSKLYRITNILSSKGYIEYWDLKDEDFIDKNPHNIIPGINKCFILDTPKGKTTLVDKMSNASLISWFLGLAKKSYPEIVNVIGENNITVRNIIPLLEPLNIPKYILNNRLCTIFHIFDNMSLTKDQLEDLATSQIFENLVKSSIIKYKESYIEDAKKIHEKELKQFEITAKERKVQIEQDFSNLEKERDKLKDEITELKKQYDKQSQGLIDLDEKKEKIVSDFQVIKEVLSLSGNNNTTNSVFTKNDIVSFYEENRSLENSIDFSTRLKYFLNEQGIGISQSKLFSLLVNYYMILIPNIKIAYAIIKASGKCNYVNSYVGINWKSFDDLWNNGLAEIVSVSNNAPEIMHYLILQNINLSYMPSFLQPMVDIQNGFRNKFPRTGIAVPNNLRIICTITEENAMPLSKSCLKYIGCYPKNRIKEIQACNNTSLLKGYLTPEIISEANELQENYVDTYFEDE